MGKRGPKPIDVGLLNVWEFEWYKAFHLLRDGLELPYSHAEQLRWVDRSINRIRLEEMERSSIEEYCRKRFIDEGLTAEEAHELSANPKNLEWAEKERTREIGWLKHNLQPKQIERTAKGREIWNNLISACTPAGLREATDNWARMRALKPGRSAYFPADVHILASSKQFLYMKNNSRFPRSDSADDSRLEYLARGMAGVMSGVSPMTAIERLRNMKHTIGGPLWREKYRNCGCWRCEIERSNRIYDALNDTYKKELKP
ncbi:MAG: hypothetical protein WCD49_01370 [Candidatus Acidiferrales bacterium]